MFDIPVVNDEPVSKGSRRSGIMLCYPFEEKRLYTWKAPYIIQPKLDGVRCRAIIRDGQVSLISSEGHLIEHVSHINEELKKVEQNVELDGELYVHGMSFQDIIKRTSRSVNTHADAGRIEYHIFDIVDNNVQIDRLSRLNQIGFYIQSDCIKIVPPTIVRNFEDVMEKYNQYIESGYEGFVIRDTYAPYVRKRSTSMMKFKPHQKDEYFILDTVEEISIDGIPKGTLGAFVCTSSEGTIFNVGTGLTQDQRIEYWKVREQLVGMKILVKYQTLTQEKAVPRFPVFLEVRKAT